MGRPRVEGAAARPAGVWLLYGSEMRKRFLSGRTPRAPGRWLLWAAAAASLAPGACPAAQRDTSVAHPPAPAPAPALERPLSLQEAIQIALQNHARIAIAEESLEAARQRVRQARVGT